CRGLLLHPLLHLWVFLRAATRSITLGMTANELFPRHARTEALQPVSAGIAWFWPPGCGISVGLFSRRIGMRRDDHVESGQAPREYVRQTTVTTGRDRLAAAGEAAMERLESRTLLATATGLGTLASPRLYKLNTAESRDSFFTALPSLPVAKNAAPSQS